MPGMSSRRHVFNFTKWYFDCVCNDGLAAVGYWTVLAWRGFSLTWQALSIWEHDRPALERSTLVGSDMPSRTEGRIAWSAPALECSVTADVCQQPLALRLFQSSTGFVDWRCEAPLARVALDVAGFATLRGLGYVERLDLTIPPWQLPIRELRWGRWTDRDAAHSIVWIDWRGEKPHTWVFVDGVHAAAAEVHDDRVDLGTSVLTMACSKTLSSRALDQIVDRIPPLRAVVPASLLAVREVKWSSLGTWERRGESGIEGPALHERVMLR